MTERSSPDIVQRLRNFCVWNNRQSHYEPVALTQEAAAEIERLRVAQCSAGSVSALLAGLSRVLRVMESARHPRNGNLMSIWEDDVRDIKAVESFLENIPLDAAQTAPQPCEDCDNRGCELFGCALNMTETSLDAAQAAPEPDTKALLQFVGWVDSWVSNPVGAYSTSALDGLFRLTRERISALPSTEGK